MLYIERHLCVLFCLVFVVPAMWAQNAAPRISEAVMTHSPENRTLTITYDLEDEEGDPCTVVLKVAADGGRYYEVAEDNISGDIGAGIAPGKSRSIHWVYPASADPAAMSVSISVWDTAQVDISDIITGINGTQLRENLQWIEGVRHLGANSVHLHRVRDSLETIFLRSGLDTERQSFSFAAQTGQNILGRKAGLGNESLTYIVDGHYDSVAGSPGADDNGSAVTGLVEAARILSRYEFEHSIRFIGFDFEEAGLIGSVRYNSSGIAPQEQIGGVFNMEMIGYYSDAPNSQQIPPGFSLLFPQATAKIAANQNRGDFLINVGNSISSPLRTLFDQSAAAYVPDLKVISLDVPGDGSIAPDLRRSDHAPFWDRGIPALMLTDGANFRNPHYHTAGDTIGTLNFTFMEQVVKAIVASVATLARPVNGSTVSLGLVTSTEHVHHQTSLAMHLYPNPSDGLVRVKMGHHHAPLVQIRVYALDGTCIYKNNFQGGESLYTLDLQHLQSGSYIIVAEAGETSATSELILKR